jgi:hypothetical protein
MAECPRNPWPNGVGICTLAEELQQGTIERVLAKSDLELGIEALLRMTKGR